MSAAAHLEAVFRQAKSQERAAFIAYVMTGDPDIETTRAILDELARCGVDLVELGVPYGDPLADGPTIAAAGARALSVNTGLGDVFDVIAATRQPRAVPVVMFTYFNPVYRYGIDRFASDAASAGALGAIVPDLPLEESDELRAALAARGLAMPLLVAPSTPAHRAERIVRSSGGFVYVVSRLGVTGARQNVVVDPLRAQVEDLRRMGDAPLAVGFGVSNERDVREVAALVDGVIVGSAIVDAYAGRSGTQAAHAVGAFVRPLVAACRRNSEGGDDRPA